MNQPELGAGFWVFSEFVDVDCWVDDPNEKTSLFGNHH